MEQQSVPPQQGPIIGIIIVVVVLIIGGLFFFNQFAQMNRPVDQMGTTSDIGFAPTATSDDPVAIQNDLEAEDFNDLDAGLNDIDAQMNQ